VIVCIFNIWLLISFIIIYVHAHLWCSDALTQQLMKISAEAEAADNLPEVPVELLKFLDQGVECNPYRFQFELFEKMETSGVVMADKVKRLKVSLHCVFVCCVHGNVLC
jgi:hypothetical protein